MKYRKKSVEIEAIQFLETKGLPFKRDGAEYKALDISNEDGRYKLNTLAGWHNIKWGDWVIKNEDGKYYLCNPDIFKIKYEKSIEVGEL